ncbi:hypothetical protein [Pectinatus haikarae]|uniref:Uncharacterized protein YycO n=1 Tax=Pectinatus haikarae TaxID=349096 RepID=A0ABT9Y6R1_9FIRM|nr:hypothetical protein [Pectinatus haikarae]MDQ0203510.1 uncharacterized protein YycO [Pectinatus haikarae]
MIKSKVKKLSVLTIGAAMLTSVFGAAVVNASPQEQHPTQIQQESSHNQKPTVQKKHKKEKHNEIKKEKTDRQQNQHF